MSHAVKGAGEPTGPDTEAATDAGSRPVVRSSDVDPVVASDTDATTVTVWRSTTGSDAVTVFVEGEHTCRQVVDYATEEVRTLLGDLPTGTTLPIRMEPVAARGDGWRVTAVP